MNPQAPLSPGPWQPAPSPQPAPAVPSPVQPSLPGGSASSGAPQAISTNHVSYSAIPQTTGGVPSAVASLSAPKPFSPYWILLGLLSGLIGCVLYERNNQLLLRGSWRYVPGPDRFNKHSAGHYEGSGGDLTKKNFGLFAIVAVIGFLHNLLGDAGLAITAIAQVAYTLYLFFEQRRYYKAWERQQPPALHG